MHLIVLILVVVEDGLREQAFLHLRSKDRVLILVVVEDGLRVCRKYLRMEDKLS